MKKILLTAAVLIAVSLSAAAESLYRLLPAETAVALRVRFEELLADPLLKTLAGESGGMNEALREIEKFSTEEGREVTVRESLFAFVDKDRWTVYMECDGVDEALFRTMVKNKDPKAEAFAINGRPAFRLSASAKDESPIVLMLVRDELIAAGNADTFAALQKAPRMDPKAADKLESADELVVLDVLNSDAINALLGDQETGPLFRTLHGTGSVVGEQVLKLRLEALCTSDEAAQTAAMQFQQLMMIGVTFGLSADPELAQQILQRLKIGANKENVSAELDLTREMLSALAAYKEKAQAQRQQRREQRKPRRLEPTAK